jgi:adenosylcobinamide-phosphate synthase
MSTTRHNTEEMWLKLGTLGLALAWDRIFGEPPDEFHPVVGMGRAARKLMGKPTGNPRRDFARGLAVAVALPAASAVAGAVIMRELRRAGTLPALIGGAFLLKSTFAVRAMNEHARRVEAPLKEGDIEGARKAAGMIVSRDVSKLDAAGIANTAVGSVAENVTDSVTGPLLAYAMFGVPGALAYRAVNTLDAMYGYHGEYEYLGKAAARLDDAVNYIPARIAGPAVVAAAAATGMDAPEAARTMAREHSRTPSPNSGWPIGAAAGAMGVEIEKVGYYKLGPPGKKVRTQDIDRSLKLFNGAAAVTALLAAAIIIDRHTRR